MDEHPRPRPAAPGAQDALADRVYRSSLSEGERALRGASRWRSIPVTLAVYGALAGLVVLVARPGAPGPRPEPSVALVLQEEQDPPRPGAAAPGRAPGPAPAAIPAAVPAPAPAAPLREPPAAPAPDLAGPAPQALPTEDHSRDAAGPAGASAGPAGVPGGTGSGAGPGAGGAGTGAGGRGGPGWLPKVDQGEVKALFRPDPPPYPALALRAGQQGIVLVEITVGPDGVPVAARALSGPGLLRAAAEALALKFRFEQQRVNGAPIPYQVDLPFPFRIK